MCWKTKFIIIKKNLYLNYIGTLTWWATLHAQITQNKHLFKTISLGKKLLLFFFILLKGSGYWGMNQEEHTNVEINLKKKKKIFNEKILDKKITKVKIFKYKTYIE